MALTNLSSSLIQNTYQKLVQTEGGLIADGSGSAIDSLTVTASFALVAQTALDATVDTGSLMTTGSISGNTLTFTKGDASTFDIDLSGVSPDLSDLNAFTGSAESRLDSLEAETGSIATEQAIQDARLDSLQTETGSLQSQITANAGAISDNAADIVVLQGETAALNLETGSLQTQIDSLVSGTGSYATVAELNTSSSALQGNIDTLSSSLETRVSSNTTRIGSLEAETGSYAKTDENNVFTGNQTFNDITVNGTGSFAYIESVTGSAKVIGDAFLILNNDTPTQPYAGIKVQDSGSTDATSSFFWNANTDDWMYEYTGSDDTDHAVAMFGPEFDDPDNPLYLGNNRLPKGDGGHHLVNSNITDTGTLITMGADTTFPDGVDITMLNGTITLNGTGTVTADSFVGDLTGNADTADSATSASFASTASYALNANIAASTETGNILFSNIGGEIYGSAASPVSGNITVDGSSTKVDGAVAIIYHTDSTEPTISGATVNKKVGIYESGSLNIITLTNVDGTNILEYIAGGDVDTVTSASFASNAATADSATSATTASYAEKIESTAVSTNLEFGVPFMTGDGADIVGTDTADFNYNPSSNTLTVTEIDGNAATATTATTASYALTASAASTFTISDELAFDSGSTTSFVATTGFTTGSLVDNIHPTIASSSAQIKHIVTIDQEQYNSISGSGDVDDNTFYLISDATDDVLPDNLQVNGQIFSPTHAGEITSATSSIDFNNGNFATLAMTSATFLANPTNLKSGTTYTIILDSGSLISGHGSAFKFAGGTAPTYTNGTDVLTMVSDGTDLYATALTDFQ